MSPLERTDELKHLQEECFALEEQAGISQAMERAREGRFIPLGAMGEEASPDEYFADEYDHFRDKARDAYFSVQEVALRKKLIAAQRKIEIHIRQSFEIDIAAANRAVSVATARTRNQPWTKAAVMAVGAVAVGYWAYGLVGAIAGAVGGAFLGQGVLSEARNNANAELEHAAQELEQARKDQTQRSLWPECFSWSEEFTGERQEHLDSESAYANVLQAGKAG
jgi:hypothetical protein